MASQKRFGSTKRYGARYGRKLRYKISEIEKIQKAKQKCPYCKSLKVKRLAAGIWSCAKCSAKFTSRAYNIGKTAAVTAAVQAEAAASQHGSG